MIWENKRGKMKWIAGYDIKRNKWRNSSYASGKEKSKMIFIVVIKQYFDVNYIFEK